MLFRSIQFPGICLSMIDDNTPIQKLEIKEADHIMVEIQDSLGRYIFKYWENAPIGKCSFCNRKLPMIAYCNCNIVHYCCFSCKIKDKKFHEDNCKPIDLINNLSMYKEHPDSNLGVTGLLNLGNTCYMNSGLQCLSNTWQFTEYFLKDFYYSEINKNNNLGLNGEIALCFARVMKKLWYT